MPKVIGGIDVLVIGSGAAGLRAAIEARRKRAGRVIVVSKGRTGRDSNSVIAKTGHSAPFGHSNPLDSPEKFYSDTLKAGCYINDEKLVWVMARDACKRVLELEAMGVKFDKANGRFAQYGAGGHTYPRGCYCVERKGVCFMTPLKREAERINVEFMDNIMITSLMVEGETCHGAIGINKLTNKVFVFQSRSTILATGGAGQIYLFTDNVYGATGDGYTLAFEAEAKLVDMEFVQFFPTATLHPIKNVIVPPPIFEAGAKLLNSENERFMYRYAPRELEDATRDILSRAIFKEVEEGRGVKKGVILSLKGVDEEVIEKFTPRLHSYFSRRGVKPWNQEIIVSPTPHFFMGGVKINEKCETGIKGLFAAGEVTGGAHGANRLPNNALTECQVFGAIAGEQAARHAETVKKTGLIEEKIEIVERRVRNALKGSLKIEDVRKKVKQISWGEIGVVRSKKGLMEALNLLQEILDGIEEYGDRKAYRVFETRNILLTSLLVAYPALKRSESRGAHFRKDFPREEKGWLANIILYRKGGESKPALKVIKK